MSEFESALDVMGSVVPGQLVMVSGPESKRVDEFAQLIYGALTEQSRHVALFIKHTGVHAAGLVQRNVGLGPFLWVSRTSLAGPEMGRQVRELSERVDDLALVVLDATGGENPMCDQPLDERDWCLLKAMAMENKCAVLVMSNDSVPGAAEGVWGPVDTEVSISTHGRATHTLRVGVQDGPRQRSLTLDYDTSTGRFSSVDFRKG